MGEIVQIIYDFDGVMFDSCVSVKDLMYPELAESMGMTLNVQQLDYCFEHSMADNVAHIFGNKAWPHIKALCYKRYYQWTIPMPRIKETLQKLRYKDITIGICSNRISGIAYILDYYHMSYLVSGVVTSKEYPPKPDPAGLLSLIEDDKVLFVGDSWTDRMTALNAGIPFISYNNPNIEADYHISNHLQILDLTPLRGNGIKLAGGK